jgi:subfamily B ATP-binding cassette protein MsbA
VFKLSPDSLKLILQSSQPFRQGLILAFLFSALSAATEPILPYLMAPFLNKGFSATRDFPLWWVPASVVGVFILRGLTSFLAQYAFAWVSQRTVERIRQDIFTQLQSAPVEVFRERPASQLIGIIVHEVQLAMAALSTGLFTLIRDSLTVVGLLLWLFILNWKLAAVAFVVFPVVAGIISALSRVLKRLQQGQQSAVDALAYAVEENVLAHRVVRLQNAQQQQSDHFSALLRNARRIFLRTEATAASGTPITQVVISLGVGIVLAIAVAQAGGGGTTVGEFASFITTMLMLMSPFKALANLNQQFTRASVALDRAVALLALPAEISSDTKNLRTEPVKQPAIRFENVSVHYQRKGDAEVTTALKNINLDIKPGETLALVGGSGSGKTTLANLLPGFTYTSSGTVTVDGTALPQWHLKALRESMAMVSQEVVLLDDTLANNVTLGLPRDDDRLLAAIDAANLTQVVQSLVQGVETVLGHNGQTLSGGQRQRVAIARALYKNAPILILDEATSALDSESEALVQQALERLMQGRTVIVIAHRLSTIERASRIAVLHQGELVEIGTHSALLAQGGIYARLHSLQRGAL